jgi:tripartite-type tricarboxylate transporter receptor subunit TctC
MTAITRILSMATIMAAGTALTVSSAQSAAKGADYFKGKTISYIVSTGPGGGHDFYARLMARNMERFLPGVTIVVRNVPGAGHVIGINKTYTSKPNGLTIGTFSTGLTYAQIVGLKGLRADLTKMSWIGKQASDDRVLFISSASPFKNWDDLVNAKRTILLGTSGAGSGAWNESYMVAHAFGLNVRVLPGYSGNAATMAMLRKEFDGRMGGLSSQLDIADLDPGKIVLQFGHKTKGATKAMDVAKTPLQKTVVRLVRGQGALYRIVAGPPGIPKDRLEALREAFRKAHLSKQYRADAKRARRPVDDIPVIGEDVAKLVKQTVDVGPELTAMLKKITAIKPPMAKHKGKVSKIKREGRTIFIMYKGKEVSAKVSGSRTKITVKGKKAKRKKVKVGMTCQFTYPRAGAEAKNVDCN